ncbi:MAG: tetratricopeptide repeat protein, partial [Isosphaeraceae bacterium]
MTGPRVETTPVTRKSAGRRPPGRVLTTGGLVAATLGLLGWASSEWWYGARLSEARRAVAARRYGEARQRLAGLVTWWPDRGEPELLLGICEQEAGRLDAAVAALSRIPSGCPQAEEGAQRRGEAEMDRGRLSEAERVFREALGRPGRLAVEIRHDLMQLLWQQGRLDEARALIERNWEEYRRTGGAASDPAITNLRAHLSLDLEVYAVGRVRTLLDQAEAAAPDDDRVWLGRANLALRDGKLDEARRWLERCTASRPDDPVVWSTALELAMADDDFELAVKVASHLATADLPAGRLAHVRAWFAARRDDRELERTILEAHLAREPGDTAAIERLAELAILANRPARAAELRHRKTELDRARRLYANRVASDFRVDALELAGLAESLGRRFEDRAILTIAAERHPDDPSTRDWIARLERSLPDTRPDPPGTRLSGVVGAMPALADGGRSANPAARVDFRDDAEAAGLIFGFENGATRAHQLPETMSGGVGLLDYDGDGRLDIYAVQGGPFPPQPAAPFGDRLFRNRG